MIQDAVDYIYLNVSSDLSPSADAIDYITLNAGENLIPTSDAVEYVTYYVLNKQVFIGWGVER